MNRYATPSHILRTAGYLVTDIRHDEDDYGPWCNAVQPVEYYNPDMFELSPREQNYFCATGQPVFTHDGWNRATIDLMVAELVCRDASVAQLRAIK